jgi:N-acetylglucosamine-6-sulfatase
VVRYDPITAVPTTDGHLVTNIDLAPTFAALAGVPAPGIDGMSFLPLLTSTAPAWRTRFLIEHLGAGATYCAVRGVRYKYVIYKSGEEELYDLQQDPFELQNQASNPADASMLDALRGLTRDLCSPPVPGVTLK